MRKQIFRPREDKMRMEFEQKQAEVGLCLKV